MGNNHCLICNCLSKNDSGNELNIHDYYKKYNLENENSEKRNSKIKVKGGIYLKYDIEIHRNIKSKTDDIQKKNSYDGKALKINTESNFLQNDIENSINVQNMGVNLTPSSVSNFNNLHDKKGYILYDNTKLIEEDKGCGKKMNKVNNTNENKLSIISNNPHAKEKGGTDHTHLRPISNYLVSESSVSSNEKLNLYNENLVYEEGEINKKMGNNQYIESGEKNFNYIKIRHSLNKEAEEKVK